MEESNQEISSSLLSVTGKILACQDKPLVTSDDGKSNVEDEEDAMKVNFCHVIAAF